MKRFVPRKAAGVYGKAMARFIQGTAGGRCGTRNDGSHALDGAECKERA